ncbi:hypothetical protein ACFWAN_50945 [Streptomyces mirabilis]|uniref:hypothetical protein n=1 Tax=Streptomyces mirabilis TaxID=68239 RepID=UPI003655F57A
MGSQVRLHNEVADTDPRYEDFSVWHYRTDSWWWQHQSAVIRLGRTTPAPTPAQSAAPQRTLADAGARLHPYADRIQRVPGFS